MSTITVGCLLIDGEKRSIGNVFKVKIAEKLSIAHLKEAIRDEKLHILGDDELDVWKFCEPRQSTELTPAFLSSVHLVDRLSENVDEEVTAFALKPETKIISLPWEEERIHMLVQRRSPVPIRIEESRNRATVPVSTFMTIVFCCRFLRPINPIIVVHLDNIIDLDILHLKKAVYQEFEIKLKKAGVDVNDLTFFKLPSPLPRKPLGAVTQSAQGACIEDNLVYDDERLSGHPEWQERETVGLCLLVGTGEHQDQTREHKDTIKDLRIANFPGRPRTRIPVEVPMSEALPENFRIRQADSERAIFCSRPREREDILPPTLLCREFAQFEANLKSCEPTVCDIRCFNELSVSMSEFFYEKADRVKQFKRILAANDIVHLEQPSITKHTPDGAKGVYSEALSDNIIYLIVEAKNEIGDGGVEPVLQGMLYWLELLRVHVSNLSEQQQDCTNFPVVILSLFGSYMSAAVGAFAFRPNIEILTPVIPLHFHWTNLNARTVGERFICALRLLLDDLKHYYEKIAFIPSRRNSRAGLPFLCTYTSEGVEHRFSYDKQLDEKRTFMAHLEGGRKDKIYVKFTRRYSEGAHRAAAELGLAPKLRAVESFGDGWKMVVMDDASGEYRTMKEDAKLTDALRNAVDHGLQELHDRGYVHGDVRKANIMIRKDKVDISKPLVLFIDFDWAGDKESAKYPSTINMSELVRPDGVVPGGRIFPSHDKQMIDLM